MKKENSAKMICEAILVDVLLIILFYGIYSGLPFYYHYTIKELNSMRAKYKSYLMVPTLSEEISTLPVNSMYNLLRFYSCSTSISIEMDKAYNDKMLQNYRCNDINYKYYGSYLDPNILNQLTYNTLRLERKLYLVQKIREYAFLKNKIIEIGEYNEINLLEETLGNIHYCYNYLVINETTNLKNYNYNYKKFRAFWESYFNKNNICLQELIYILWGYWLNGKYSEDIVIMEEYFRYYSKIGAFEEYENYYYIAKYMDDYFYTVANYYAMHSNYNEAQNWYNKYCKRMYLLLKYAKIHVTKLNKNRLDIDIHLSDAQYNIIVLQNYLQGCNNFVKYILKPNILYFQDSIFNNLYEDGCITYDVLQYMIASKYYNEKSYGVCSRILNKLIWEMGNSKLTREIIYSSLFCDFMTIIKEVKEQKIRRESLENLARKIKTRKTIFDGYYLADDLLKIAYRIYKDELNNIEEAEKLKKEIESIERADVFINE